MERSFNKLFDLIINILHFVKDLSNTEKYSDRIELLKKDQLKVYIPTFGRKVMVSDKEECRKYIIQEIEKRDEILKEINGKTERPRILTDAKNQRLGRTNTTKRC